MARGNQGEPTDWVTRAADDAIRHARDVYGEDLGDHVITCASGASPSGPIHLGNLREFLTVHFVAEEIKRRGIAARHLHSWDDYDRFRKVPAGIDPSFADHIGRPLSSVPDPWDCHQSWADHFKAPLQAALAELGVAMEEMSQTERYRAGTYRDQILTAVRRRDDIEQVMAKYRTKQLEGATSAAPESPEEAAALADSVANDDESGLTGLGATDDLARFPFKPYCRECGRDTTIITSYDEDTTDLAYTCQVCAYQGVTNLTTDNEGKLVWKVDWPMRWSVEGVDFEPGGVDHATPGSSYTVGKELVKRVYGGRAPSFVGYSFVGAGGQVKMSSSRGGVPTASDALQILEAPILRWLYVRRQPKQAFNVDFGAEVVRLYDEWDALAKKSADPERSDAQTLAFERASSTSSAGRLPTPAVVVPFRLLSSVADVTAGSAELISTIIGNVGYEHASVADLEPRLGKAMTWTSEYVPTEDRTTVRETPDADRLGALNEDEELWLRQLLDRMPDDLHLDDTTALIYGVPKLARGLGLDDAPTDQVKQDQKDFFRLLYNLLVDADRGPRLPTLFLALGAEKIRTLLTPPS
ncbi:MULTISPECIES: lysine--tRNA ligase [unclassified Nocardioides]|uniref:lysine--tRNA ligase n=1 Tax=unclassified Nocardioides TaxID=2615069 RepID=UPI0009F0EA1B|nr:MULTISPECIES: lysine--tRNA ligase [unclassified Nocardioides]GAW51720.1 Lysine--tRNA ligase [Nocardioides sp. PD653-B2]GAW55312.1 Lysine--tRNA ligase [Nocardioides sp. PD653]